MEENKLQIIPYIPKVIQDTPLTCIDQKQVVILYFHSYEWPPNRDWGYWSIEKPKPYWS